MEAEPIGVRYIRWIHLATLGLATAGMLLIVGGALAVPLAGWGGAYIFAGGVWLLIAAAVAALMLLFAAAIFRWRTGRWYFGTDSEAD